ncbi:MAG TPA: glycosyltransferase family 39 protein [Gammaproteobacteria bacterium]|nr:glycosyltransferase family 39 protein [Gammaproteobacteria bacterium]
MNKATIDEALADGAEAALEAAGLFGRRAAWWGVCALLGVLALLVALPGIDRVPLDSHEIFVAQSAREMSARGDWLLPYFNGVPRLNKPPMSYWLTGLVAGLAGALPDVAPAHARLVSIGAGLGTLLLSVWLGVLLYGRQTAVLAGLVLLSSAGYFSFTHDARPDLLYTFFTTAMILAAVHALRGSSRPRLAAGLTWLAFACATLTKGPHLPAFTLLGLGVQAAILARSVRAPWRALRVWPGFVLACVPVAAWWGWLRLQIDPAALGHSQLAGSLLAPAWQRFGDPYYLYRPLQLLLPWLPLVLLALGGLCLREGRRRTGWLWWPLAVAVLALSCGRQYRYFYLLPLIAPLTLAFTRPVVVLLRSALGAWPRQLVQLGIVLQILLALACAGWVLVESGRLRWLTPPILASTGAAVLAILVWRALARLALEDPAPGRRAYATLAATAVFVAAIWPGAAWTGVVWSRERFDEQALCAQAAAEVRGGRPLATLGVSPTLYVYATNTRVPELATGAEAAALVATHGAIALVVHSDRLAELGPTLAVTEIARARRGSRDDVLVRVEGR